MVFTFFSLVLTKWKFSHKSILVFAVCMTTWFAVEIYDKKIWLFWRIADFTVYFPNLCGRLFHSGAWGKHESSALNMPCTQCCAQRSSFHHQQIANLLRYLEITAIPNWEKQKELTILWLIAHWLQLEVGVLLAVEKQSLKMNEMMLGK